ncbi:hypothetical protein HYPSUDRAFT_43170 [Hypholoma sublateritium FD-334 SS-4]|uniref:Uncharacterized protein n=1 Tax=Hypholoma sublateritium (strain FD-334 SS-4) TaxID=945553 RepID=A0A0D2PKF8_HYPSF|nr:hypothetical protein HYPSUDRAFT_43170 [Hypholoma sublateritium FD-334 SS-4]
MVCDEVANYRCALNPVRRLPDDILRSIFLFSLPDTHNSVMSIHEPPLILGCVSKRWRSVSRQTPLLWSSLHIGLVYVYDHDEMECYMDDNSKSSDSEQLRDARARLLPHCDAIRQWLLRAGTCPLSISMDNHNTFREYFSLISSFSHFWRRLEVCVSNTADATMLASIKSDQVPMLEHLWVNFGFSSVGHKQWVDCGILNAPNLHSVHLSDFTSSITDVKANWERITNLVLFDGSSSHKLSIEEALAVFRRCVNLVQCTLAIERTLTAETTPFTHALHLPLPYLQYFSVNDHAGGLALEALFLLIDAPSLHHVVYSTKFWPTRARRSPLLALLTHNGTSVRHLTTDPRYFRLPEFLECILLTPFLEAFDARISLQPAGSLSTGGIPGPLEPNKCSMNLVLLLLTPQAGDADSHVRWPRLTSLVCDTGDMVDDSYVLAFLCGRMEPPADARDAGVCPMRMVHMRFWRNHQLDIPAVLTEHVARGLDLRLKYMEDTPHTVPRGRFDPRIGISRGPSYETFSLS